MQKGTVNNILTFFKKYSFNGIYSGLLLIIFTFIALARALQHFYIVDINEPVQYSLWWHVPFNLFMWWNWFLFIPLIYWTTIKFPQDKMKTLYWIILFFLLPIAVILLRQFIATFVTVNILPDKRDFRILLLWRLFNNPWFWLDVIVYLGLVIGMQIIEYKKKSFLAQLRSSQLENQLAQSQLNALKSQLQPHFLFNTLNTISTLILKKDNSEAEKMLTLLNNYLNKTLTESERQEITLEEELRFIRDYLAIEKVRFSDKLEVRENITAETLNAIVPCFLLQPIVENAVYHGIAHLTSNGIIQISSEKKDGKLIISVENNVREYLETKFNKNKSRSGIGLKITKERLVQLYGSDYELLFDNISPNRFCVKIVIPFTENPVVKSL